MRNKIIFVFAFLLIGIFVFASLNFISAVGESTICCEKTKPSQGVGGGAWCQNVDDISKCDTSNELKAVPTSCESTSYCKLGTCVNVQEGVCMENTPQRVCEAPIAGIANGLWFNSKADEIPQCQLGCCLIGEQAAFTTQTRCEQLSSLYGLEINYRTDIQSEAQCIASAFPKTKGACVFEEEFQKNCRFTTKEECQSIEGQKENVEFHENILCSSEQLGTICGPSEKTTILEGRDEVFFVDTCGNQGNIYDADRQDDRTYWDEIVPKAESCGFQDTSGNAQNPRCGNCDYLAGSTGALYDRFIDGVNSNPTFGDYVCRNLDCKFKEDLNGDGDTSDELEDETFKHGESWCARSSGVSEIISEEGIIPGTPDSEEENIPGSRYFRMVCYNGEVTVEPCADFRQEVCIESEIEISSGVFRNSACRVNKWQDCSSQESQLNCENFEKRDCVWKGEQCIPKYAPGFNFWESGDADALCIQASKTCTIKVSKNILGAIQGKSIKEICENSEFSGDVENCKCLEDSWKTEANNLCLAFGDCGISENYIGKEGFYDLDDLYIAGKKDKVPEVEGK